MRIKKRRIIMYALGAIALSAIPISVNLYCSKLTERILPKNVVFKIDNEVLQTKISSQIQPIIAKAIKTHKSRSQLLSDISEVLARYKVIDAYTLRLGFDGNLIVSANVQKPVLAVHAKNGDTFVIGSGQKIIAKNPHETVLQTLPNLFFPETQITWTSTDVDFFWFLDQVNLISENLQWQNAKINKILWTDSIGFTVKFDKENDSGGESNDDSHLVVYLGLRDIDIKAERFKTLAMVLKQKNLKPHEIDLDSIDRVFIK